MYCMILTFDEEIFSDCKNPVDSEYSMMWG